MACGWDTIIGSIYQIKIRGRLRGDFVFCIRKVLCYLIDMIESDIGMAPLSELTVTQ